MKNIILISIFYFVHVFSFASTPDRIYNLPDSLNIIVTEMAHSGVYENGLVGFAGSPSQQDIRLNRMKAWASGSELLELTKNASAIVRLYAFIALLDKKETIPSDIWQNMVNDKTIIVSVNGCIAAERSVGGIASEIIAKRKLNNI